MERLELTRFIESRLDIPLQVYPLDFPKEVEECAVIEVINTLPTSGDVTESYVDIHVRSKEVANAEKYINELRKALNNVTDVFISDIQIIQIKAQGKFPLYEGRDDNGRFYFRQEFRFLED